MAFRLKEEDDEQLRHKMDNVLIDLISEVTLTSL